MTMLYRPPSRWRGRPRMASLTTALQMHRVLSAAPCPLPSELEERTRLVASRLKKGDPSRWAEIVRDLTWHQRKGQADRRDMQFLQRATSELSAWLAGQKGIDQAKAKKRIREAVERSISVFS